jgi:hypothetical protein
MAGVESIVRTYVLRVWQEGPGSWRGHITDVTTGERQYVDDIDGVAAFLAARMELMGLRCGLRWRVRTWLRQRHPPDERS